jgi:hypothetical protein
MDRKFNSGSLTGYVLLASRYRALPCECAERFAPRAIRLVGLLAWGLPAAGRRTRAACRCPLTPPTFPIRPSARAPNPGPLGGTSKTSPRRGGHAHRQSGRRLPPGMATGHRPGTVPADQVLVRTPGSGSPADGHGGTRRPSGRPDVPVQCGRPANRHGCDRPASVQRRTPPVLSVRPCA